MRRPPSIRLFAIAFASTVVTTLIGTAVTSDRLALQLPDFATLLGDGFLLAVIVIRVLFAAGLGFLVVVRASNLARWFVTLLMLVRLTNALDAWAGLQMANPLSVLWVIGSLSGLFAVTCLFTPESSEWFASKRSTKADAAVFE